MIEARDITVHRGGRTILDGVSLTARPGDFIAVIGPNGAGKSTLLSVLAGLVRPEGGRVTLDGVALADMPARQLARARAYLPQNPVCEWPISVERLVALGLSAHLPAFGGLPAHLLPAVDRALEACDLQGRRAQPVTTLSGGEFARAMLARALVGTPALLIVDEPITGLDPAHAMDGMRRLAAHAAAGGIVIASLHDLTLAARHASTVVALKEGRVLGAGALSAELVAALFGVAAEIRGSGEATQVELRAARNV